MSDTLDILTTDEAFRAISMVGGGAKVGEDLEVMVTAISRRIDAYVGPVVVRTVTDELYDANGSYIELLSKPVQSVSSVIEYVSGTGTTVTAESVSASGGYLLRDHYLARRSGFYTTSWQGVVKVTYVAGRYADTASVDELYKMAAKAVLVGAWSKYASAWSRGGDPFGDPGSSGPGFFDEFLPAVRRWLGHERLGPVVA